MYDDDDDDDDDDTVKVTSNKSSNIHSFIPVFCQLIILSNHSSI